MSPYLAELIGTMILIVLGDGVVANVVLRRTKGQDSGWIVITAGWAAAVTIAVYCVNSISGAHLNPAVTIALASIGAFPVTTSASVPVASSTVLKKQRAAVARTTSRMSSCASPATWPSRPRCSAAAFVPGAS